jgi:glycosyltransferase involved in cell wall biosynthesis
MSSVVHWGKYFPPDRGGIESVTSYLAIGARKAGFKVTVVCFGEGNSVTQSNFSGVRVLRAPIAALIASQPLGLRYLFWCLRASLSADIIHLHTPNMLGALCALLLKRHKHLVVHWHSDVINKGLLGLLLSPLERALLRRADKIIATSPVYAEASQTLLPFKNKVCVVPIGVGDLKSSTSKNSSTPSDEYISLESRLNGKKLILSVGRLVPYKGFDVLISAASHLPAESMVVIVGTGPLELALRDQIASLGLGERVILAGKLSDSELSSLFNLATLYCLPSVTRAEAFGVVLIEAMAYGLPIVATNIVGSGVPWVNRHGFSGVNVSAGDANELAQACVGILNSNEERSRLSRGSRERFLQEFTEDASARQVINIYNKLLSLQS